MKIKLGYLVPEFPGQTHIFFWREIKRLEQLGAIVDIVSTRFPHKNIVSHSWSDIAKERTTYLFDSSHFVLFFQLLLSAIQFGPAAWLRCIKSILKSDLSFKGRLELLILSFFGARLSTIAIDRKWNHLHVHSCANSANIALFANLLSGLQYSITLHGPISDYGLNQKEKWHNSKFGIVITKKLYAEVSELLGPLVFNKLHIAPMGVNLDVFSRASTFIPYSGVGVAYIYCVGRLNPCKGHVDLISAIAKLKYRGVNVHLDIAGEDELGGAGYHRELQDFINSLNLATEVKLLGAISENAIREGLSRSHAFALASLNEPLGVAIMEAMALEMPVVVTSGGGVTELVEANVDGILVPPENPEALADAILNVLSRPELATRLAQASRSKIVSGFQDTRSAEILLKLSS